MSRPFYGPPTNNASISQIIEDINNSNVFLPSLPKDECSLEPEPCEPCIDGSCGDCYPDNISLTIKNLNVIEHPFDGPIPGNGECIPSWEDVVLYNNRSGSALNITLNSLDYRALDSKTITLQRNGCASTTWSGSVLLPEQWYFQGGGNTSEGCRETSVGASVTITTTEREVSCILAGGSGNGAYATASVSSGGIGSISVTDGGMGYAYKEQVDVLVTDDVNVSISGDGQGAEATATIITNPGPGQTYGDVAVTITNGGTGYSYAYINVWGSNSYYCWPAGSSYGDAIVDENGSITGYNSYGYGTPFIRTCSVPEGDVVVSAPNVVILGTGQGASAVANIDQDPLSENFGKVTSVTVNNPGSGYETGPFSYLSIGFGELRLKANWEQNCNLPVEGLACVEPKGEYTTSEPCARVLFKEYDVVWGSRLSTNVGKAPPPVECPNASSCHNGHYADWGGGYIIDTAAFPDTGKGQMTIKIRASS